MLCFIRLSYLMLSSLLVYYRFFCCFFLVSCGWLAVLYFCIRFSCRLASHPIIPYRIFSSLVFGFVLFRWLFYLLFSFYFALLHYIVS